MSATPAHELRADDLECLRGEVLLFERLGLRVAAGEVLQVEGPNGSGKTSLLRMLAGLTLPETGEVYWNGEPIRRDRARFHADLHYIGHQHAVKAGLSVLENLKVQAGISGNSVEPQTALTRVGLARQLHQPADTLSAGQRRRAALARLLLRPAPLWILDEPYTALDTSGVALVDELIRGHVRAGGLVVMTSHQPVELPELPLRQLRLGSV
jgi:heme exporter protein A